MKALLAAWSSGYRLEDVHSDEPASLGNDVTRPPHLEDCKDLDDMNRCEWARLPALCKLLTFGLCFCTLEGRNSERFVTVEWTFVLDVCEILAFDFLDVGTCGLMNR